MIKILHVVSSLDGGGVESMLYNYYLYLDKSMIQFDFIVHGRDIGILEKRVEALGAKVFHVTPKKESFIKNKQEIEKIIKNGKYDIVHCHQNFSNFVPLMIAKKYRVPVRISHAHGCKEVKSVGERIKNSLFRLLNQSSANYFFACGIAAGKWLHGRLWSPNEKNIIMKNAIDTNKFTYNHEVRERYRKKLSVENKKVLLHVGRFSAEKNHLFLIEIMEIVTKQDDSYVLLLVGNGATEKTVRNIVQMKGLNNKVIFLGVRNDVAELMNAADIFLLPSKNEGFGITLIEAQSTGLITFASDKITKETAITDLIEYLPIEDSNAWAEKILLTKINGRDTRNKLIEKKGYSVQVQSKKYIELVKKILDARLEQ